MTYRAHWSFVTLILYITMGLLCAWCCHRAKKMVLSIGQKRSLFSKEYWPWYFVWIILAVFRYVDNEVGGTDAPNYIRYFENCLNMHGLDQTDILFKWFNQMIRIVFEDYHWFFLIFYGFTLVAMVLFINEFARAKASSIPLCILVFLYIRSFTSIRSNLALSVLLIALVLLKRKKVVLSVIVAISSFFIHVMSAVYIAFFAFYFLYHNRKISFWKSVVLVIAAYAVALVGQKFIMSGGISYLAETGTGVYASYAGKTVGATIAEMLNVSYIPQIILFVACMIFRKDYDKEILLSKPEEQEQLKMLRNICYFDFFAVPVIMILGIYRGYEFFYLPRLVMWGELLTIIKKKFTKDSRVFVMVFAMFIFILWMYGRIEATWESSHLMPYIFWGL